MQTLKKLQLFLENIDSYRDKALFVFINPYWPRKITPNHITYIRVLIGIILIIILFFFRIDGKSTILSLFIIGLVTDLIDGPIARGIGKVTEFGAMLDSASDRLLIMPIAIYSLLQYQKWLLFVLILTEILNGIFSLYYSSKEAYLKSNIFGKIKMVIISAGFLGILFVWPNPLPLFFIYLLWISIPFSILSILSKSTELKRPRTIK
ncbi:MAG: hypothetical protein A3D35_00755 [Candidatus Staskawiczbacteria bacterium RIFCSPHIGHO2_02_FULL_34_9]|uniref:CDP-diacylglycerol--glycerol-3-phosphate 3-phosphatidyltransferase n=1 Tax=Candidatus Staskawiczbacteria bacterium RIFCSPHIGHO2_02_FULL_34_9 TaxID=1802206 RepID=A0A1G2HYH6_9BACT|nr:MAG: hypothetical protein A3D35_00755 [Candidatus Staskawiczbacteria bacterium RIFCSPHIGHO2_02_FULL_34_9]